MPGTGNSSRAVCSAAVKGAVDTRTPGVTAVPCVQQSHTSDTQRTLINAEVFDLDPRAIVDAEAERGGVLHVPRLADDDVDVRIRVPGAPVVNFQRRRRAIPDRDRAAGAALAVDDVEEQA